MITEEKLIQKLTNMRITYSDISNVEKKRYLGGMETILIVLEVLDFGQPFPYGEVEVIEYNLFKKNTTRMRKETYQELILRLVDKIVKK